MKTLHFLRIKIPLPLRLLAAVLCFSFVFSVVNCTTSFATEMNYQALGTLGYQTSARAMNDSGSVVGVSEVTQSESHAFLWKAGHMTDLGNVGENSQAYSINSSGQVIGARFLANGDQRPFLWQDGVMQDLTPILGSAIINDINDGGSIVGSRDGHAFVLNTTTSEVTNLVGSGGVAYSINNHDQIVGFRIVDGHYRATLWQPDGSIVDLGTPGNHVSSVARSINDNEQIVGYSLDEYGWEQDAFYWEDEAIQAIGPSGNNDAFDINNSGQVIGTNEVGDHIASSFIWQNGELHNTNIPDRYTYGAAINNSGQFVVNTDIGIAYIGQSPDPAYITIAGAIEKVRQWHEEGLLNWLDTVLLNAFLQQAKSQFESGDMSAACLRLEMTIGYIDQLGRSRRISQENANELRNDIQSVALSIACQ
jgi:probable HAF family extracellular repeat protein